MNRPSVLVLVNPRARRAQSEALARAITVLERAGSVTVHTPSSRDALIACVRDAREDVVVAAGGDGTVHAVVGALPPRAMLGILPAGTANDFACELGVPARLEDAARALARALAGAKGVRAVDLLTVGRSAFCTVGGIGLVERTTSAVLAIKAGSGMARRVADLAGSSVYRITAAATLLFGRHLPLQMRLAITAPDGRVAERSVRAHALFVVNHRRCGGGLQLPTRSDGGDGVFELGIVHASSRLQLVMNFQRLSNGAAIGSDAFEVVRATSLRIDTTVPTSFVADGEQLAHGTHFEIGVRPGALRLRV